MQEVIREIIKIDQLAFQSQKNNEDELERRKEQYNIQMKTYKEQKLFKAEKKAEEMQRKIIREGEQALRIEEEKAKQTTLKIENRYLQIENAIIDRLFKELFVVEA